MDPNFTYHSQNTVDEMNARARPSRKKVARRTGWAITLADIAIITLLGIFLMPFLLRKGANVTWQDYAWTLKNQALSGQSFIALRVQSTDKSQRENEAFSVIFYADDIAIHESPIQGTLPPITQDKFVRLTLPALQGKRLKAVITFDGEDLELANSIARDGT
ncbi:MAG: hypothetical protein ACRCVN_03615 [Spirochaetia bacterium]